MTNNEDIRPFHIDVPQAELDDLADRIRRTRFPDELPGVGSEYGVTKEYVRKLADYWVDGYDWRAFERKVNAYPQFTTEIDGQNVHFLHVRSPEPDALALILTHGWPGTFAEYLDVIGPLTDPRAHGGDPAHAFHVVVPSVPGFAFSGPTKQTGWNIRRVAAAWAELMSRLGYERYGAVGNDGGSMISPEVGRVDPEHAVGVHVTQLFSFPTGDPAELRDLTEQEAAAMAHLQWFWEKMGAFNTLQAQQPQTLAFALQDSPVGQLAWNGQLFGDAVDADFILDNVTLYWLTGTAASAARFYYENERVERATEPTTVPTGLAMAPGDFQTIRRFAERDHANLVHWTELERGGHYTAHQAPDLLVEDLREFFGKLR